MHRDNARTGFGSNGPLKLTPPAKEGRRLRLLSLAALLCAEITPELEQ
jgi:hypothetical protein